MPGALPLNTPRPFRLSDFCPCKSHGFPGPPAIFDCWGDSASRLMTTWPASGKAGPAGAGPSDLARRDTPQKPSFSGAPFLGAAPGPTAAP